MAKNDVLSDVVANTAAGAVLGVVGGAAIGFVFGGPIGMIVGASVSCKSLAAAGGVLGAASGAKEALTNHGQPEIGHTVERAGYRAAKKLATEKSKPKA